MNRHYTEKELNVDFTFICVYRAVFFFAVVSNGAMNCHWIDLLEFI